MSNDRSATSSSLSVSSDSPSSASAKPNMQTSSLAEWRVASGCPQSSPWGTGLSSGVDTLGPTTATQFGSKSKGSLGPSTTRDSLGPSQQQFKWPNRQCCNDTASPSLPPSAPVDVEPSSAAEIARQSTDPSERTFGTASSSRVDSTAVW